MEYEKNVTQKAIQEHINRYVGLICLTIDCINCCFHFFIYALLIVSESMYGMLSYLNRQRPTDRKLISLYLLPIWFSNIFELPICFEILSLVSSGAQKTSKCCQFHCFALTIPFQFRFSSKLYFFLEGSLFLLNFITFYRWWLVWYTLLPISFFSIFRNCDSFQNFLSNIQCFVYN